MKNFPHQELTKSIIGIYYNVYNELGFGFLEKVYHKALLIELKNNGYKIDSEKKVNVYYKNEIVGEYIPDIIINDSVIVELKCVNQVSKCSFLKACLS